MAEYRRFISYIYAYEGDMKTKNVGFAKIEARNGQCRISVSIKGAYECSGQELSLYGYGYQEDGCLLIPLGQIPVKNGTGEAVFGKQEENLGGSGYSLSFVKGLYLRSRVSVRKAYLTTWDDTIIHITTLQNARIAEEGSFLRTASLPKPAKVDIGGMEIVQERGESQEEPVRQLTGMEVFRKPELFRPELVKEAILEAGPEAEVERKSESASEEGAEGREEPALKTVWEREPERSPEPVSKKTVPENKSETMPETIVEKVAERIPESIQKAGPETAPEAGPETVAEAVPEAETMQETELEIGPGAASEGMAERKAEPGANVEAETAAAKTGRMPEDFYFREGFMELPLWECLQKILPRKRILAETGWEVLQIHIQDIGRLPRENWPYGNNSFVLHGYFQYRYLILARRKRQPAKRFQSGYQYMIGVPGIFKPQEKFMASMFGLPEFKRAVGNREEDFGFWCGSIQM